MKMITVGKSTEGRDIEVAIISSPQNIANLDQIKKDAWRMAHATDLNDDSARALAHSTKIIVHIDGGLHSSEVAGTQHTMILAYKLLSAKDDPEIQSILDNVVLMLWPTLNPDGQDMVVHWYRQNLGTQYEVSPLPKLYQDYVGHDNNRDGYMLNMKEEQVVAKAEIDWSPDIFYCQHQTAPFPARIWIPPFSDPISSNISPYVRSWLNVVGTNMAAYLDAHNMPGAISEIGIRQLVRGLHGLGRRLPRRNLLLYRDRALRVRHAALLHRQGFSRGIPRPARALDVHHALAGRMVAPEGRS